MKRLIAPFLLLVTCVSWPSWSAEKAAPPLLKDALPNKNSPEASIYRGEIAFSHYYILCHGIKDDGKGRAEKMYDPHPANLVLSHKNDEYKHLIMRMGGAALERSQFMPPWGQELTDKQITDVVAFLRSVKEQKPKRTQSILKSASI